VWLSAAPAANQGSLCTDTARLQEGSLTFTTARRLPSAVHLAYSRGHACICYIPLSFAERSYETYECWINYNNILQCLYYY
jgi:hypothetical protein